MKSADAYRETGLEKQSCQIDGSRKLIGLDADQADQRAPPGAADLPDHAVGANPAIGLVIGVDADLDIGAEHSAALRVLGEAVQRGQRVGRDGRPEPLDRVAVIVVMRRLDQDEVEERGRSTWHFLSRRLPRGARSGQEQLTEHASPGPAFSGRGRPHEPKCWSMRLGRSIGWLISLLPYDRATQRCRIGDSTKRIAGLG